MSGAAARAFSWPWREVRCAARVIAACVGSAGSMTSYSVQLAASSCSYCCSSGHRVMDESRLECGDNQLLRQRGSDERKNHQWARTVLRNLHCNGPDDLYAGEFLEGTKLGCVAGFGVTVDCSRPLLEELCDKSEKAREHRDISLRSFG